LSNYAEQNSCYIAVVSHDQDLKKACDRFPSLMYFQSLPDLTELLLSAEDGRIATFRAVLNANTDRIAEAAYEATIDLSFYTDSDYATITDNEVTNLGLADMRIVALGEHECTIAFDAVIDVKHDIQWPVDENYSETDRVTRDYDVSGTAKVSFDATTNALVSIPYVALNEEEIKATHIPPIWERWR
jgi:hypothetical protein